MTRQLRASVEGVTCCRGFLRVWLLCPTYRRMLTSPPLWVGAATSIVCACSAGVETTVQVDVVGFKPNPTGATAAALSHLRRCWVKPAAAKPAARPARRAARSQRPAPPAATPCPAGAIRYLHTKWTAMGIAHSWAAPTAIAVAYVRLYGVCLRIDPARRAARVYSLRELRHCLGELKAKANRSSES